jgi:mono/diheme cytochrome c family protein
MWRYSALLAALLLSGCTQYPSGGNVRLHLDMVDQPSFRPQRDPLPLAEGSVAVGAEPAMTQETADQLVNPAPADAASLERGRNLFQIYCLSCHGAAGRGDGPVATKISRPANLIAGKYRAHKDGFFYYVIRAGNGGLMPPQAESMYPRERWDVVNYIRKLQKP